MQETEKTFTAKRYVEVSHSIERGLHDLGISIENAAFKRSYNWGVALQDLAKGIAWAGFFIGLGIAITTLHR